MAGGKPCFFGWLKTIYLVLSLNNTTAEISIDEHHFLAVSQSSAGIQVSLTSSCGGELFRKQFSNHTLPPECGENFTRCKDLLVVSNTLDKNVTQFVSAIPVTRAVLLLDIRHNGSALLLHNFFIVNQNIEDCNPTAIFKIAKSIYTMCFNERTSFLTVIELRIRDPGSVQKAFFARPTLRGGRFDFANQVSNFLSVNTTDEIYLVFTSGGSLTAYAPINTVMFPTYIDIQCSPERIEHVSVGVVVAYCSDRSLSIDIVRQQMNTTFYNESGYPFFCPNYPHTRLSAFHTNETYLQYQVLQGSQNFTKVIPIIGDSTSFNNSQCFGTETTFFAYCDNEGIRVINTTSGREFNLSSYGYLNPSCLNVIGGRYMIIQEQAHNCTDAEISIFDSQQNLAEVVRTRSLKADLMAVIRTSRSIEPSQNPTPTMTEDISTLLVSTPQTTPVVPLAIPTVPLATVVSIPVVVLVVVVVVVVAIFGLVRSVPPPVQEEGEQPAEQEEGEQEPAEQEEGEPQPAEHEEIPLLSELSTSVPRVSQPVQEGEQQPAEQEEGEPQPAEHETSLIRPSEQEPNNNRRSSQMQMVTGYNI